MIVVAISTKNSNKINFQSDWWYLLTQNNVYLEYYPYRNPTGAITSSCIKQDISFNTNYPPTLNYCPSSNTCFDEKIYATILSPFSGVINFKVEYDDGVLIDIDDFNVFNDITNIGIPTSYFSADLINDQYYTIFVHFRQASGYFKTILSWSYGSIPYTKIPLSNIFLPTLVGSSPYTVSMVDSIWGDAKRTGSETWDDANTSDGDGWNSIWIP